MLTKKQFDILSELERSPASTQRLLAKKAGMSLGAVNKTFSELISLGYCDDGCITGKGLEALEPYRVKRAVIMAAGFGSRVGFGRFRLRCFQRPSHARTPAARRIQAFAGNNESPRSAESSGCGRDCQRHERLGH